MRYNNRTVTTLPKLIVLSLVCAGLFGCTNQVAGSPQDEQHKSPQHALPDKPRQTDAQGQKLPFETQFFERWNKGNDGTEYEPCTAATSTILETVGFDPQTVEDAATVDGQTARGCNWDALPPLGSSLNVGQTVGNSQSLVAYKKKNSAAANWHTDLLIQGREVGVMDQGAGGCLTYVQSGGSGVVTAVLSIGINAISIQAQCDKAIEFTSVTISRIPV